MITAVPGSVDERYGHSRELSLQALGPLASANDPCQNKALAPAVPMAQMPRWSYWFSPMRTSANMRVFDVPSLTLFRGMETQQPMTPRKLGLVQPSA